MGDRSSIEWTDATWNPLIGCSKVSPGCDHCYAINVVHRGLSAQHRGLTVRRPGDRADWTGEVRVVDHLLGQPLRWTKPRKIFVNSLSDLFHVGVSDETIARIYAVMVACDGVHTFQVLTKRPQRMAALLASGDFARLVQTEVHRAETHMFAGMGRDNIWLGTSIESARFAFRAEHLRATPARVRWLSLEPLLGPLTAIDLTGIDWVVVGGESGPAARPMHPDWVRDIRDRCVEAGVAFLFKQWGEWLPEDQELALDPPLSSFESRHFIDRNGAPRYSQESAAVRKVGKKAAGRVLDGRTWDEYPAVAA